MVAYVARPAGLGLVKLPTGLTPSVMQKTAALIPAGPSARTVTRAEAAITAAANSVDSIVSELRARIQGGAIVELDRKTPCPAGPWSDDVGVGKDHETDPNHCLSYGGPFLTPMLELPIGCEDAHRLLWADLGDRALAALRILMANKPTTSTPGDVQFLWYRSVLSACTLVGLALNVSPRMFTVSTDPKPGDTKPWGKYEVFARALAKQDALHAAVQREMDAFYARSGRPDRRREDFFAVPVVCPSFVATSDEFARAESRRPYTGPQEQVGWNDDYTYADSLYRQLLTCKSEAVFGFSGFRGVNVGQSTMWRGAPATARGASRIPTGHDAEARAPGFHGRGFAFPNEMLAAGSSSNNDTADRSTRDFIGRSADARMRALFVTTATKTAHVTRGYFRSRTYWVGGAPPHPARAHDHWERCWAPTARYFIDLAEAWGQAFLEIDLGERISSCLLAYTYRIKRVIKVLREKGHQVEVGVGATLDAVQAAAQRIRLETGAVAVKSFSSLAATIVTVGLTIGGAGGWIGLIIAVVVIILAFLVVAFVEIAYWNRSPREQVGEESWSWMLDAFFLRTPKLDSGCAPDPEAGVDLMDKGFSEDRGYGAPFARMARGEPLFREVLPPPPPAESKFPWVTLLVAGGAVALLAVAVRK